MTVIYYMSIDRADKPWIGDRRLTDDTNDFAGQNWKKKVLLGFAKT